MLQDSKLYQTYLSHIQALKHHVNLVQDQLYIKDLEENPPSIQELDDKARILYL